MKNCKQCGANLTDLGEKYTCEYCGYIEDKPKEVISQSSSNSTKIDFEKMLEKVFIITCETSDGTAFLISDKGILITNYHVVNKGVDLLCINETLNKSYSVKLIGTDKVGNNDISILKIENYTDDIEPFELESEFNYSLGDEVSTIGNGLGLGLALSKGYISRLDIDGLLQLNLNTSSGNSGGPIISSNGTVIGVTKANIDELDGMTFAIGADKIKKFIKKFKL